MRKQGGLLEAGALLSSAFKTYPKQTTNRGSIHSIVITIRCIKTSSIQPIRSVKLTSANVKIA